MVRKIWKINKWHGGMADSKYLGGDDQCAFIQHFETDSEIGALKHQLDLEDDTTGLEAVPNIQRIIFSNKDQKVYALGLDAAGKACLYSKAIANLQGNPWVKAATVSAGAIRTGENQALIEFNDYLYFTEGSDITRYGLLSGTPSLTEGWGAANFGYAVDASAALIVGSYVYFAHTNYLSSYDGGTVYNYQCLDIDPDFTIQDLCIDVGGNNILIAAQKGGQYGESRLYTWDRTSASYNSVIPISEGFIKAIRNMGNFIRIIAVKNCQPALQYGSVVIYDYAGGNLVKKFEYQVLGASSISIERDSVFTNDGCIYMGINWNDEATYAKNGIYRFGSRDGKYRESFNCAFLPKGTAAHLVKDIYAAIMIKNVLLVSYLHSTTSTNYLSITQNARIYNFTSTYESLVLDTETENKLYKISVKTNPLPANTTITLSYKVNEASAWTTIGTMTTAASIYKDFFATASADFSNFRNLQLKLTVVGNGTMDTEIKIREINVYYDPIRER